MKERKLFFICFLLFAGGFLAVHFWGDRFLPQLKPPPAEAVFRPDDRVCVTGRVWKKEEKEEYNVLYLKDTSIIKGADGAEEPGVILYDPSRTPVRIGNILSAAGEIFFFEQERNPGNFNQKFYYQKQNIHAGIWAGRTEVEDSSVWRIRDALSVIRANWSSALTEAAGEKYGGILSAMILGDRQKMDRETKELYQVNGIAHILSISGLHLSFIGIGSYQFLRRRTGSYLAGGLLGILLLFLYILMIGTGVAVLRAFLMLLIRVGADITGRAYDTWTALAVAAVAVVCWNPLSYYDGGFQMSFGAILGICILSEIRRAAGRKKKKKRSSSGFRKKLKEALYASLGVQIILFPVILYHYFEFPVYSVFLNLLVVPLMSALLLSGMAGSLLYMAAEPAGKLLLWICCRILDLYEFSCRAALLLPGSRLVTGRPEPAVIWFYFGTLAVTAGVWILTKRYRSFAAAAAGAAALILARLSSAAGMTQITMVDVGQGDCCLIRSEEGKTFLIDGGSSDVDKAGRYRIEPFLKEEGIGKLDYVAVTHGDIDHMNGIRELIARQRTGIRIGCLLLPSELFRDEQLMSLERQAEQAGIPVLSLEQGKGIRLKSLTLAAIQPQAGDDLEPGNEASLVLLLTQGRFQMLFTGDVEGRGEELLTARLKGSVDVLKTAHHGSGGSTSEDFLKQARPRAAFISAGPDNPYGHPAPETLAHLEEAGALIYLTARHGAVTLQTDGETLWIKTYL